MQKIKLHFVCNGNVYRSRLAAAYAKKFGLKGIEITSSGVLNYKYDDQPRDYISPWAQKVAKDGGFEDLLKGVMTKTTKKVLATQDIIVFMNDDVFETASREFGFPVEKAEVWHVKDRQEWKKSLKLSAEQRRQRTWKHIKSNVTELIKDICSKAGWVDIVDEKNQPLRFSYPLRLANKKGLWHRGCHVVITTPSGKVLTQKRSKKIVFSPRLIDVTLGGHVDAGEEPVGAMLREIQEETGLVVGAKQLRAIGMTKQHSYHPKYKMYSKAFIYDYHLALDTEAPKLTLQRSEVERMDSLTRGQVKRLIKYRKLKPLGRLNYPARYYAKLVEKAFMV